VKFTVETAGKVAFVLEIAYVVAVLALVAWLGLR